MKSLLWLIALPYHALRHMYFAAVQVRQDAAYGCADADVLRAKRHHEKAIGGMQ